MRHPSAAPAALLAAALLAAGCASPPPPPERALLDVPPVVQKEPAYCAPATLARALAFADRPVPQDILAVYGGSKARQGSDVDAFYRALAPLLGQKDLRLRPIVSVDPIRAFSLARAYNRLARANGRPRLRIPDEFASASVDLGSLFGHADPALLRQAAAPRLPAFEENVVREIAAGRPLLWGVVLGVVPEPNVEERSRAGHLRLIVGYANGGATVLYSDPWGPDCPVKRMASADACAITQSLHVLEPGARGKRP
ncbi:MAG: hypothetical protein IJV65_08220 [Kiritimatiellae bacterium]|nr:hypothetical protein [Kiritimatiellia bacterium]